MPSELDRQVKDNTRTVLTKTFKMSNLNTETDTEKYFSFNVRFKKPKMIEYGDTDFDGHFPLNRFFWHGFCCQGRHDQLDGSAGTESPTITANVILRYHEKLD